MSDNNVNVSDLFALCARQNEILKRVKNGGLDVEEALLGTQKILDGKVHPVTTSSVDWQSVTDAQIATAKNFYSLHGYGRTGYRTKDIPAPPIVELKENEILFLYAPLWSLQETFDAYWAEVNVQAGYSKERSVELRSDNCHLRTIPGTEFSNSIKWVIINLSANQGKSPKWCIENATKNQRQAHVHILMAMCYFKEWSSGWNGIDSPLPNMTGLQSRRNVNNNWSDTPYVHNWKNGYQLRISSDLSSSALDSYCSPTYRLT